MPRDGAGRRALKFSQELEVLGLLPTYRSCETDKKLLLYMLGAANPQPIHGNQENTMLKKLSTVFAVALFTFGAGSLSALENIQEELRLRSPEIKTQGDEMMAGDMKEKMASMMEKCSAMMDKMQKDQKTDTNA